ncbi:hypothetical protein LJB76_00560 [Clostridia bacterium OttesenSCG-928-O13]|nr:hypothetical protein [Clostridia bacterium OttesenSCG-928-O13]
MRKKITAAGFLLFILGCSYTAPQGDSSWSLWFLAMAGLLVWAAARRAKVLWRRRRQRQRQAKLVYYPPRPSRRNSA